MTVILMKWLDPSLESADGVRKTPPPQAFRPAE